MLIVVWLVLTFVISYINAASVGRYWTEKSELPASYRLLLWSGAIMAVCGFFMVYGIVLTLGMAGLGVFPAIGELVGVKVEPAEVDLIVETIFSMIYLIVIFPVLGSGLAITANSLIQLYQRPGLATGGIAVYNTGAQVYNTYNALRHVPEAAKLVGSNLGKLFKGKGDVRGKLMLVLLGLPLILSLGGAIATTVVLIRAADAKYDLAEQYS